MTSSRSVFSTGAWATARGYRSGPLVVTWVLAMAFVLAHVDRGWGPPDEGLLGQTAERFLRGEIPHRDFDDLYTGGLTALHAAAFAIFGVRLVVLRWVLAGAVACWIPVVYALARRFAAPVTAASVTLLAVVWSVPAYPAAMPSWYNLFFASAGLLALFHFAETGRPRWMFGAGVAGGLSILFKVVGLYFVAAAGLVAVYTALEMASDEGTVPAVPVGVVPAVVLLLAVLWLVRIRPDAGTLFYFVAPALGIALALAATAARAKRVDGRDVWAPVVALGAGVVVGVLPIVVFYAQHHALDALVRGALIGPTRRLVFASREPHLYAALAALPLAAVAVAGPRARRPATARTIAALIVAVFAVLVVLSRRTDNLGQSGDSNIAYRLVLDSVAPTIVLVTLAYAAAVVRRAGPSLPRERRVAAFAAITVAALCSLIGFPYYNDLYFYYVAPLVLLAVLALLAVWGRPISPWIATATLGMYLVFGATRVAVGGSSRLAFPRGGLRVYPADSAGAGAFVDTVHHHATDGYLYAMLDAPEAYFMTGLENPTRTMYEFFDDTAGHTDSVLRQITARDVRVVVTGHGVFSPPEPALLDSLRARYPDSVHVWRFTVRWRQ